MYQRQGKDSFPSLRTSIPPERHLFLQGTNGPGDTGLVLSTDAKPRLKWTTELHERFVEAVKQLGGADKATPKTIMRFMGIPGLTLYHLKSHLQKYRLSKNLHGQANSENNKNDCTAAADRMSEGSGAFMSNMNHGSQTSRKLQISEALQMQIEVQRRRLHEQLEVQQHLQLRIEAQGKYLQSVLEKAQETLGRQNLGSEGLEAAKVQLSEEDFDSTILELKEMSGLYNQPPQRKQIEDCSMESCLTSCEGSLKDKEMHKVNIRLRNYNSDAPFHLKETEDNSKPGEADLAWHEDFNESKMFSSERIMFPMQKDCSDLHMRTRVHVEKSSSNTISEARRAGRDEKETKPSAFRQENEKPPEGLGLPYLAGQLDLNSNDDNDAASSCKQLDLNGVSWN